MTKKAENKETTWEFVKGGLSSALGLLNRAVGDKNHKRVGTGFMGVGGWKIIEGAISLDPVDGLLGLGGTAFGAILRWKPAWLGIDVKDDTLVAPPSISLLELNDEQMDQLAERLGLSVHAVYQAHEIAQLDDEALEKKIQAKYGDLLERAAKGGTISDKEKAVLTCIRIFGEAHKREQGEVAVK